MPAPQTEQENCVAHNGSLIPVPGRDIMVQAWYQGGVSVFDFTDSAHPIEIAFFDRGPIDAKKLMHGGGFWSAYWYNGYIYGSEIARGLDVFELMPSEYLSQNEIDAAKLVRSEEFNAQEQPKIVWPASSVVARAYLDQLTRTKGIAPARAAAVTADLERVDRLQTGQRAACRCCPRSVECPGGPARERRRHRVAAGLGATAIARRHAQRPRGKTALSVSARWNLRSDISVEASA